MPSQTIPSLAPSIHPHLTDNTLPLPPLKPTNQSKTDAAVHQLISRVSAPLPSSPQHQANCLHAIHKTIQQFSQHFKEEHLDRQTLQLIVLHLQNDFALLRYLLFSPVETISNKNITVKNSTTSPLLNPTSNLTSSAFPFAGLGESKLHRLTPVDAVGPPKAKTNKSANDNIPLTPINQEAPSTATQNLTSRIYKLEKLFADEVANYTAITAGIHSQYFFLFDKIRQLEPGHSDVIIWKIPSVKFVFDSAKMARPSFDPLIEPATSFSSLIFRTHPHGYNFFVKFFPYGIGPATGKCASMLFTLFPGVYDNLLQWPFSKSSTSVFEIQLDPMNTWMKTI